MRRRRFSIADASRSFEDEFEPSPMESVANMSDVMLVLAVALMVALVAHWGVSMTDVAQINESNMKPIEANTDESAPTEANGSSEYEEVGAVYRDTDTGELYVVGG